VIGAHYDHLGYGEDGNSMLRANTAQIHNGADDNASGTSALLELSTLLRHKKYRHYNYLFIAFSAEELGLLGSKFFADHHDFKKLPLKYMINLDMVGRLNDSTKSLTIGGFGTSKDWATIFSMIKVNEFNVKLDSSGTGPSDHTSFYRKDMPVLFYFTGLHTDYHKPSDDAEKINIQGTTKIIDHISNVIKTSKNYSLPFSKTREQQTSTSTRFSVSLGIMPDYSFSGDGVRVDGVSEGKLAQQIGIKASDIIKKLGDVTITSVESYMKALSKFKKGDNTIIEYLRGNELLSQQITFK
jgi:Zn-dependent M28 family amino/carboxypeptidase